MKTFIEVKTHFEALHRWVDAPESSAFLRHYHRHIFSIKVKVRVDHDNRELEFFEAIKKVHDAINAFRMSPLCQTVPGHGFLVKFDLSCEAVAAILGNTLRERGMGVVRVEVAEDKENSGIVEYDS